jgi:hypothetical protein
MRARGSVLQRREAQASPDGRKSIFKFTQIRTVPAHANAVSMMLTVVADRPR